jgi:hypothetical protein
METLVYATSTINPSRNKVEALLDMLTMPNRAFTAIRAKPRWFALPLLLTLIGMCGFFVWYFLTVDLAWLAEQAITKANSDITPEQANAVRAFYTPKFMLISSIVGGVALLMIIYLLQTTYLYIAANVSGTEGLTFADWFSFSVWASLPGLVSFLTMSLAYALAGSSQIEMSSVNVMSLNALIFNLPPSSAWSGMWENLTIGTVWSLVLMGYGYSLWTGCSRAKGLAVSFLPYVLIYGTWAVFIIV